MMYASAFTALISVVFLQSKVLLWLIIVLGQGHFLTSYFYLNKIGRIDRLYFKNFLTLLLFFGFVCYAISFDVKYFGPLILFTSMAFVVHYFFDEAKLSGVILGKGDLILFLPVFISFAGVFTIKYFEFASVQPVYFSALVVLLSGIILVKLWGRSEMFRGWFTVFYFCNIFIPLILLFVPSVDMVQISGFIIIFHYIRWYLYYYLKFSTGNQKKDLADYLSIVFWVNVMVVLLFVLYTLDTKSGFLALLFHPLFFYGWTCVHIFLSVRKTDFPALFKN